MSGKSSDQLHKLIHALNKQEKRHFKIFAGRHTIGEQNNYVVLFDAVERMKEYDEEALLKKFSKEAFINNFSITKGRLYETILRSLDVFHHNSSVDAQLWKELHYAEILYKKTLYEQCAKRLKSARKLAEKYEKHAVLVQIHSLEKTLFEKDSYAGMTEEDLRGILREDQIVADHINTYNDLWNVKSRLFMMLNTKGRARGAEQFEQFKSLIDASLGNKSPENLTVWSRFMYHHTYSAYYFAVSDAENCRLHLSANVELIESNTEIFSDEPNVYFGVLTNLIYVCSRLKRYSEVLVNLNKLRALPEKLDTARNEDLEVKLFASAYSLELALYNSIGQFDKAVALVPKIAEGLERFDGRISKIREAHFCISCAVALYGDGKLQQSLRWTSRLLNDTAVGKNEWIFATAQVFSLILHIELDHRDLIPYTARNVQRYLKTRNRSFQFENVFLKFTEKVAKTGDNSEMAPLFAELNSQLNKLEEDQFEKSAFEYFDFPAWASAKVSGRNFRDVIADKAGVTEELG
jgi:exonuclease VII small subunit